jgi:hypothetical protein
MFKISRRVSRVFPRPSAEPKESGLRVLSRRLYGRLGDPVYTLDHRSPD